LGQSDAQEKKKEKVTAVVVTFLIAHVWSMLGVFNRPCMVDAGCF
jgi:hypothetical protein